MLIYDHRRPTPLALRMGIHVNHMKGAIRTTQQASPKKHPSGQWTDLKTLTNTSLKMGERKVKCREVGKRERHSKENYQNESELIGYKMTINISPSLMNIHNEFW